MNNQKQAEKTPEVKVDQEQQKLEQQAQEAKRKQEYDEAMKNIEVEVKKDLAQKFEREKQELRIAIEKKW